MPYESDIVRRAGARLAAQRQRRADGLDARRMAVYEAVPEAARIDAQLRETVARAVAVSFSKGEDPVRAIEQLRAENLSLQQKRLELIRGAGFSPEELDEAPACKQCGDTGWTKAGMCACLRALCAEEQVKELSKLLDLGNADFAAFSLDWYPLHSVRGGVSPRENMEFIFTVCRDYAAKFPVCSYPNLYFYGGTGLGKTFLSACIARAVAERGYSVVYDTAVNIFARFEAQKFSRDEQDTREAKDETRRYLRCDLLILDDLGSELTTPFVQSALYTLINSRLSANRRTIISSNLSLDDARARYTPQIASRLEGEFRALPFMGEDIRLLRKQRK